MTREHEPKFPTMHEASADLSVDRIKTRAPTPDEVQKVRQVVAERSKSVAEATELLNMLGIYYPKEGDGDGALA